MINRSQLLSDLQALLRQLEDDLAGRTDLAEVPEIGETLRTEYDQAQEADRTAQSFGEWVDDQKTQVAVAWILSATFARFLEDNELVSPARLSGPGEILNRARDEHEAFFREHPTETDREYLLWVFEALAKLPGAKEIFGEENLIWANPRWLSGDAAGRILTFFQTIDPSTGALVHDFTDEAWDTRFLGDLYQDLSTEARKKYALLQTPTFVEEFILDRTLEPAVEEFGLADFRMIDPACGSGHFVLGAFHRLLDKWQRKEPGTNVEELARRALESVNGVDLNPFAVAIARFRLLLAAMKATGQRKLRNARAFPLNLACGDSLIHGDSHQLAIAGVDPEAHTYSIEDMRSLMRILIPGHYHAVVANPPYIVPKDKKLNGKYRERYEACYRQYSLAVPFMERVFQLAGPGGFTGQITANSFMKREFGKKLIETFFPKVDLTHVIDTSGAYIPGHGTPTVILFGRNREPVTSTIRTVMGIRGEPSTPEDATQGLVWSAILAQVDVEGSESEFVSVADSQRELFHRHPWSLTGGGAVQLFAHINSTSSTKLNELTAAIGRVGHTGNDEAYFADLSTLKRQRIENQQICNFVEGEQLRDWQLVGKKTILFPYGSKLIPLEEDYTKEVFRWLWLFRDQLWNRREPNGTHREIGKTWYELSRFHPERFQGILIAFAFVATHNHFVLDRGGKVFKQSAPVIKLPATATEDDHLALLGLLNSSTACFWMKQVMTGKHKGDGGSAHADPAYQRFEFDGTKLKSLPISNGKPIKLVRETQDNADILTKYHLDYIFAFTTPSQVVIKEAARSQFEVLSVLLSLQEELDWGCYKFYSLLDKALNYTSEPPKLQLGQRAFEIVLARKMAAGELETTWFERHNSTPITELPDHWPDNYKQLVERRIQLIETDKNIGLIEQPEYKRRWNTEPWESQLERALETWLLNRLESYFDLDGRMNDAGEITAKITDPKLTSTAKLADIASQDPDFIQVGELYTQNPTFDILNLINTLTAAESVPLLPVLRYKPSGLRKRQDWEHTWELQRQEDAIDARTQLPNDHPDHLGTIAASQIKADQISDIPVPPKYKTSDFQKSHYWKLRGKLDVPKERWVSFPHCDGPDGQPVIAWAGYDHLQLAQAISAYYVDVQERFGGRDDPRLRPLLGCLLELVPWLKQWHNDLDPAYGLKMGDYYEEFIQEEARQMGLTWKDIPSWEPPKKTSKRRKR